MFPVPDVETWNLVSEGLLVRVQVVPPMPWSQKSVRAEPPAARVLIQQSAAIAGVPQAAPPSGSGIRDPVQWRPAAMAAVQRAPAAFVATRIPESPVTRSIASGALWIMLKPFALRLTPMSSPPTAAPA